MPAVIPCVKILRGAAGAERLRVRLAGSGRSASSEQLERNGVEPACAEVLSLLSSRLGTSSVTWGVPLGS